MAEVKVTVGSEKVVTVDDIVAESVIIWKKCKERGIPSDNPDVGNAAFLDLRREHREFGESYPIVLRYMTQMGSYSSNALRKYLIKIKERPWTSHAEYLDSQADYVCILFMETHKRWNRTEVSNLRKNVRALLQQEHDDFMSNFEKHKAAVEAEEAQNGQTRLEQLKKYVETMREINTNVGVDASAVVPASHVPVDKLVQAEPPNISADSILG